MAGLILALTANAAQADKQQMFERVFGDAVRLEAATVAKVKALPPGERLYIDRNGDGKNDEVWFIDTHGRHSEKNRPLLVRVIDEDGDLDLNKGPDLDSDLYVADYQADGTADVVLDYQDNDGDGDVDEMGFFFWQEHHPYFGDDVLRVWWSRDDGDDNQLGYDVDYTYDQRLCQYRWHMGGEEMFIALGLRAGGNEWAAGWENPFVFYDPDGDQCSEIALRIEGRGDQIRALRYSFDADDDAFGRHAHDYDFSITAIAEQDKPLQLPAEAGIDRTTIRGLPTQGWLGRAHAQKFVVRAPWHRALLTWDEMNANTEYRVEQDPHERWEGVIAHGSQNFPQIGGPPCSPLNKRNEVSLKPILPLRLYYDATDRRMHLRGANEGWLHVDFDYDGKIDMKYTYLDDDQDGLFDRRQLDLDGDGQVDFDWKMQGSNAREIPLEFRPLADFYKQALNKTLADGQYFIDAAKAVLGAQSADPVEVFFLTKLESWTPQAGLGAWMRKSPAGARYYLDLLRDRLFFALQKRIGLQPQWGRIEAAYAAGDYYAAADTLLKTCSPAKLPNVAAFQGFTRRLALLIENTGSGRRDDWPITIPVNQLRKAAPDFNPEHCAVVDGRRWLGWRQVPHQVDRLDPATGQELSFLADLPADVKSSYYLYYAPTGRSAPAFPRKTGTAQDWVPPNIGWESNRAAYRTYYGQFDYFGKKIDGLIYDNLGAKSYHDEVEWGIDALHTYNTGGVGGITLYKGDEPCPVRNPQGKGQIKFTKRVLVQGPVRCAIEITAENVVAGGQNWSVRTQGLIYAERQESEIRTTVEGGQGDIGIAASLIKLAREAWFADPRAGCFGNWGFQDYKIDEIGMSVIVSPTAFVDLRDTADEHRIRCRSAGGKLRYWIVGDWRRGRQYPIAPTVGNWHREMGDLANLLLHEVKIEIGRPEPVL